MSWEASWGFFAWVKRNTTDRQPRTKSARVLVVNDAAYERNHEKEILAAAGLTVVGEAANGLEAVEKFKELSPDLVVMDVVMPFMSGLEAMEEI